MKVIRGGLIFLSGLTMSWIIQGSWINSVSRIALFPGLPLAVCRSFTGFWMFVGFEGCWINCLVFSDLGLGWSFGCWIVGLVFRILEPVLSGFWFLILGFPDFGCRFLKDVWLLVFSWMLDRLMSDAGFQVVGFFRFGCVGFLSEFGFLFFEGFE
jgi:hypothetical protein